ncbi:MAG: hypothetical protein GX345_01230 [Clostridiales bacterium]|nr:hypothetical protein [Clostridiales bacterium]
MDKYEIYVNLSPSEAVQVIKQDIGKDALLHKAKLLHESYINFPQTKTVAVLVYERFYMRSDNRGSLTIIIENSSGRTLVQSVASGTSSNPFFSFDWGAGDDFAAVVLKILKPFEMQKE